MKKTMITIALAMMASAMSAQTKNGGISPKMLQEIQAKQSMTQSEKALSNALKNNAIDLLARDFETGHIPDTNFSVETPKQSITNQLSSGRCWMFSGFNVLRSNYTLTADSIALEFSQAYLFFYDQLEKANLFLQGVVDNAEKPIDDMRTQFFFKSPIGDGGTFCGVADLTTKYGLVPKQAMAETYQSNNTSTMRKLIASKLREYGLQLRKMVADGKKQNEINATKTEMLSTIYRILSMTIGEPPAQFTWQPLNKSGKPVGEPKQYTPKEFFKTVCPNGLEGTFIMVMNDPRREYHKTYEVEYDRHTYDGHNWVYLNLPMEEIEQMAIASLKDGHKLYSSYDVGKLSDRKLGYADLKTFDYGSLFGTEFPMNKADRISTFDSGSTHAMTLTAVDLDKDGKPVKWKVENSWGADSGYQGCMIMTAEWFREYMFRLVVDKKYVPEQLLKEAKQKPVMVMPEDPLFAVDD